MSLKDRIRRGDPLPLPVSLVLASLTPFTRVAMWNRLRQPRVKLDARVISFGNLTAGGSGKTPAVIERARIETAAGRRVAVLTRGYGAATGDATVIETEPGMPNLAAQLGDEPALIARKVPGIVIAKGADRVASGREAIERFGCDTLILDDGYQYVRLDRDENVVVIDAANPFGSGHLLPRGILREPLAALRRATHVVLTRCDQSRNLPALTEQILQYCPGVPLRFTRHAPKNLIRANDGNEQAVEMLHGLKVIAACGIGHPEAFFRTLEALGAEIVEKRTSADHSGIDATPSHDALPIIVTEKDSVRMQAPPSYVWALAIELEDLPPEA